MRPRTSEPRGITSTPPCRIGSSSTAINVSPILFFSLLMLSIIRMTTFEPVGMVQPVLAAFEDVGRVTRCFPGTRRGSVELLDAFDVIDQDVDGDDVAVFSSPN